MSQAEFARTLGVDPSNLSKLITGKLPVTDSMINRIALETGVSRSWLRDGTDYPFSRQTEPPRIALSPGEIVEPTSRLDLCKGTPVYDIDVAAGPGELSNLFTADRIVGMVNLPNLNPKNYIVHVSGDSMTPVIANGGYLEIRPVKNTRIINWGQIYVVILEDYCVVKYLRSCSDSANVILRSANTAYDDMVIPRDEIRSLYYVETILNIDFRG